MNAVKDSESESFVFRVFQTNYDCRAQQMLDTSIWAVQSTFKTPVTGPMKSLYSVILGTVQRLSYDMAGGEETILEKNLLAPYEIIAEKLIAPPHFP